jgi:hypothetical protein
LIKLLGVLLGPNPKTAFRPASQTIKFALVIAADCSSNKKLKQHTVHLLNMISLGEAVSSACALVSHP